jgi:two-component system sensor histidine kinase RegB
MAEYVSEIVKSFQEVSKKDFIVNYDQNSNPLNITKSIEIVYGLRNLSVMQISFLKIRFLLI